MAVVEGLVQVRTLVNDVEGGFRKLELPLRYFEPLDPIAAAVTTSLKGLGRSTSGLLSPVTDRHLTLLEVGASLWFERMPNEVIDERELQDILGHVRKLFEEVRGSSLPLELRSFILSMLTGTG